MKIYSDTLTREDLIRTTVPIEGLYIDELRRIHRPRVRRQGWDIVTASTTRTRWKNSGVRGAERLHAASWEDHGRWFAALYELDPHARIAFYEGREDFHARTKDAFRTGPEPESLATVGVYVE